MGWTTGTANRAGAPLRFRFRYNGTDIAWSQPVHVNDYSNSGETVDDKFKISDFEAHFADVNGSYFATQFGRGTLGFGSSLEVMVYIGGTMDFQTRSTGNTHPTWLGSAGANVATIHTGNIYNISYSDRLLKIRSKSKMGVLSSLKLQFPIEKFGWTTSRIGSVAVYSGNAVPYLGTTAFFDNAKDTTRWKCWAYNPGTVFSSHCTLDGFGTLAGRGTVLTPGSAVWPGTDVGGTNFYEVFSPIALDGTYIATYIGTIDTAEAAQSLGFKSVFDADRIKTNATTYPMNKSLFYARGTLEGDDLYFLHPFTVSGTPKEILTFLMTGAMVTPLFTSSDLDTTTFNQSGTYHAFSYYEQKYWPDSYDQPLDSIKQVIETTQALFSVNSQNKFEYISYGPKNLTSTIPSLGTANVIDTEFSNDESDFYNRFVVRYGWDGTKSFNSSVEEKIPSWSKSYDRLLEIKSKWIRNPNEAIVLAQRLKNRYARTFPRVNITTNIMSMGIPLGSLVTITDQNSGVYNKIVQVVGFNKRWEGKKIEFNCWDAEALFQKKGYAFWGTGTAIPLTGNEFSSAIWGTTYGTMNTTVYGSQFSWW